MLFTILMMRKKQSSGGGPFALLSASADTLTNGTSCSSRATGPANITYEGDPTGVTLKLEHDHNGTGWITLATGLTVASFPYMGIDLKKYYQKFAGVVYDVFRVTNEADAGDTVTSDATSLEAHDCGV